MARCTNCWRDVLKTGLEKTCPRCGAPVQGFATLKNTIPLYFCAGMVTGGLLGDVIRWIIGPIWHGAYVLTAGWGIIGMIVGAKLGKRRALQVPELNKELPPDKSPISN